MNSEFALTSQLVDRGLAITPATPALQGAMSWSSAAGWSLGVSAGATLRNPGHLADGLLRLSRAWMISDDWQTQASLSYSRYSGIRHTSAFEADFDWIYRDVLTLAVAAIHTAGVNHHRVSPAVDLNFHWPLARHFFLLAGTGMARYVASYNAADEYDPRGFYHYGQAGLMWNNGAWRIELDRVVVNPGARHRLGDLVPSPWLISVSRSF